MTGRLRNRYRRLLGAAVLVVWWERAWVRLWPAASVAGLFLAFALTGLPALLPAWVHSLVLLAFVAVFLGLLWRGASGLRAVGRDEARTRLERDSGLAHHPLAALEDAPATVSDDARGAALWRAHVERAAAAARALRLAPPAPGLARHDPLALRAAVLLLVVVGLVSGFGDWGARLWQAVTPPLLAGPSAAVTVDAWITPPAYTGRAPVHLSNAPAASPGAGPVVVPAGSAVLVQAAGLSGEAWAAVGEGPPVSLERIGGAGPSGHRGALVIEGGDRLAVGSGSREAAAWPLSVLADRPPTVAFAGAPAVTREGRLILGYEADDDYGVTGLDLVVSRDGRDDRRPLPLDRRVRGGGGSGRAFPDLTAHAWAGLAVSLVLEVRDARNQAGRSKALSLVLPERPFRHPVARALIDIRRTLAEGGDAARPASSVGLEALAAKPEAYQGDTVVHLALRVARTRLLLEPGAAALESVRDLLWKTALRLEDGGLSLAERDLDRLGNELRKALDEGASAADLERLARDLGRAMDRFLEALLAEVQRDGLPKLPPGAAADLLAGDALKTALDEIRDRAAAGDLKGALDRLDSLRGLLQEMAAGLRDGPSRRRLAEAARLTADLKALEMRQEALLEETWNRLRDGTKGVDGVAAERQRALSRDTEALAAEVEDLAGDRSPALDTARAAMDGAVPPLSAGCDRAATEAQGRALAALRQARRGLSQAMAAAARGGATGLPRLFAAPGVGTSGLDPFGRLGRDAGTVIGGATTVPTDGERKRVREILEDLRRRAGDTARPPEERAYFRRLLRRF